MNFANPWLLAIAGALIVGTLVLRGMHKNPRAMLKVPHIPGFRPPSTFYISISESVIFLLRLMALVLMAVALSRPQEVTRTVLPPTQGVDIMLVIDTSGSMRALDFEPLSRMDAAKKAAAEFIKRRNNDRIGIVVFAGAALLQCPLTLDYDSLLEFLDQVDPSMTGTDGTAIGDAIATGTNHLKSSKAKSKVMVLLTDGRSNTGIISDPALAAKAAAAYGIKIYAIGTAGKGPARAPISDPVMGTRYVMMNDDLDEETLSAVAKATGGEFYRAQNMAELQQIYSRIDSLEKTEFKSSVSISRRDQYLLFLLPAALLLLAEIFLSRTVFFRLP